MTKILDKVSEAYNDGHGTAFGRKVRERIHWICEHTVGQEILDVGCSQGIGSILLGREGKRILGMDLAEDSIDFAKNSLEKEAISTREMVEFQYANFLTYQFENRNFDTVIFGEILEHLLHPKDFIQKAKSLLKPNGRIIVTVPFGINDWPDHKKTYYLNGLLKLADESLKVHEVKLFGKWIGVIFDLDSKEKPIELDFDLLEKLENSFYDIERNLIDDLAEIKKNTKDQEKRDKLQIEKYKNENESLKIKLKSTLDEFESKVNELKKLQKELNEFKISKGKSNELYDSLASYKGKFENISKELEKVKNETKLLKDERLKLKEKLLSVYNKEEKLLKTLKNVQSRYNSLSNSKLGKLTLRYWKLRKKRS
jgi:ubiquinone/menaquinone biosynthesis C-methylase UbiE